MVEQTDHDFKQMHLKAGDVKTLFGLYLLFLAAGLSIVVIAVIKYHAGAGDVKNAILYCMAMSLVGSSVYYVRKLYKALINESYTFIDDVDHPLNVRMRRIGTVAFFIFRPVFGVAFAVVIFALWRLSLSAAGTQEAAPTLGFLFTTIVLGFVSGFLAGRILSMLEGYGARRIGGFLGGDS